MTLDSLIEKYRGHNTGVTHCIVADTDDILTEWYLGDRSRDVPHMLHSATKSFVSSAVGLAVAEGQLDLDAPMLDYLPSSAGQPADPRAAAIRVRDLLTMRTGHGSGSSGLLWRTLESSWIAEYLGEELVSEPGTDFIYSSGTSHMLAVCVQEAVGERLDQYLRPRLFEPFGFRGHTWATDPEGYNSGGNGLSVRAVDLLKWGVLYLRGGEWNGHQLLPASWVEESTTWHVGASHSTWNGSGYSAASRDDSSAAAGRSEEGYGYQIWLQDGAYYASGMFGQACVVVPDADRVIAVNAALERPQARELVGDLIDWARADVQQDGRVSHSYRGVPIVTEPSELCSRFAGEYITPDGASELTVRHVDGDTGSELSLAGDDQAGRLALTAGVGENRRCSGPMSGPHLHHSYVEHDVPIVARVDQTGQSELTLTIDYLSAPFIDTVKLIEESGDGLTLTRSSNVNSTDAPDSRTVFVRR